MTGPRICATIEARMTSSRLPGKVLMDCVGEPMLQRMVERLKRVPSLDGIVIATTVNADDDPVAELADRLGVGCFRGSEHDVMERVLGAARAHDIDVIVETTGDCPCIDPDIVERCIAAWREANTNGRVDYLSNVLERTYPVGMDTQVFPTDILADAAGRTDHETDREHVSLFIYRHPELYSLKNVAAPPELTAPDIHITLDTPEDLVLIRGVFEALYPGRPDFSLADILEFLRARPDLGAVNASVARTAV